MRRHDANLSAAASRHVTLLRAISRPPSRAFGRKEFEVSVSALSSSAPVHATRAAPPPPPPQAAPAPAPTPPAPKATSDSVLTAAKQAITPSVQDVINTLKMGG